MYYNQVNINCQVCIGYRGGVIMIAMEQRLREALSRRQKQHIIDAKLVPSAVLVPIYWRQGQYYILFTKRTEKVKEHKGQISFPGGACREGDRTLVNTALRECAEEIGLVPTEVDVLGELDDMLTEISNYIISPFVALIPWPYQFKVDGWETDEIIEVPVSALRAKEYLRQQTEIKGGQAVTSYFYHYQGRVIWGATARILHQFLDIFSQAMEG
jgi:8-oxo-dGTP pyrophosphatase MutT (NUDIX family)